MVKLYIESFKNNIKSQLEYKASFIMNSISQLFVFFTYYFIIIALFSKFDNIKGYSVYEVLLCFSIIQLGFSVNETFFRGIDKFEDLIIGGDLDRFLVRPQGILFQSLCREIDFVKVFRILQSLIVMVIALINLDIIWNISKVIVLLLMIMSSILIFFSLFVLTASYCFITVQGLEVKNVFTDGGKNLAQYPISIYRIGVVGFFTFIIPYGFINYYPLLYFIDRTDNVLYLLSPLLVIVFLIPCLMAFKIGLKHYNSAGS